MVATVSATDFDPAIAVQPGPAYPLVEAKLHPPAPAQGTVERARLVDLLLDPAGPPVDALLAGPGYGKTTLLAQWVAREPRPVAWLTLDDLDNDPAILVAYLEAAFGRIHRIVLAADPDTAGTQVPVAHREVPRLLAQLHRWRRPAVLVLDDVHRITGRESLDVLAALVDHLPSGFQVAIAGRYDPGVPLARLRASRMLLEVGQDRLALDEAETAALAAGAGCTLTADEVRALASRTEGWPAGTYLAALAHGREGDAPGTIGEISGGDRFIAAYLGSEVEARLDADEQDLLARTSVLESVTPAAATALTGVDGVALRLRAIARRNLLVHEVGAGAISFRYHNLLREYLLAELERRDPGATSALHARASAWFAGLGSHERAVEHAFASGDQLAAARLATAAAFPAMQAGRVVTVERWLAAFDTPIYEAYAPLSVTAAWVHLYRGDGVRADQMADLGARGPAGAGLGDESASFARAMLDAVLCRNGPRAALAHAAAATELSSPGGPRSAAVLWLRGSLEAVVGDLRAAATTLEAATEADGDPAAAGAAAAKLAAIRIRQGDWDGAADLALRAEQTLRDAHYEGLLPALLVFAVRARVAIQCGDESAAREHLVRAQLVRPLASHAAPWLSVDALLELARAYLAVSDPAGAQQVIREAEQIVRRRPGLGTLIGELVELRRQTVGAAAVLAGSSTLTSAELRVLPLLPTYLSFQDIADRLGISRNTVKTHAMSIYGKLWASSRGEAVERAVELGLLEPYPGLGRGRGTGATPVEDLEGGGAPRR